MKTFFKFLAFIFAIITLLAGFQSGNWIPSFFVLSIIGLVCFFMSKTSGSGSSSAHTDSDSTIWSSSSSDNSCDSGGDSGGGCD